MEVGKKYSRKMLTPSPIHLMIPEVWNVIVVDVQLESECRFPLLVICSVQTVKLLAKI